MSLTIEVDNRGTWIIGRTSAKPCPWCSSPPVRKIAENRKAILWHTPVSCCKNAIARSAGAHIPNPQAEANRLGLIHEDALA